MIRLALLLALFTVPAASSLAEDAGVLDQIRSRGSIRLGYTDSSPPFAFHDQAGKPIGYSVALCTKVAEGIKEQLGLSALRVAWVRLTLQNRLTAVQDREVDMECGTTTWTLSRQKSVDFSLMTFVDGGTVLVRSDTDMLRLTDLAGKRIGVVPGTTTESSLKAALTHHNVRADVVTVASRDEGIEQLASGKIDGYASDRLVLLGLAGLAKGNVRFRPLDEDFSVEPYALALPKGDYALRLAVNRVLAALYRSGEIIGIYDQWFGPIGKPSVLLTALYYLQGIPE
jgi:ABC-type amino acid transport substrate-binding protein